MNAIIRAAAALVCLGLAASASAETIYRHVDPEGRVSYSSEPPKQPGETIPLEVDTERNVISSESTPELEQLEQKQRSRRDQEQRQRQQAVSEAERRRAVAEQRLEAAERAWQEGQAVQPGDFMGRRDGGVRPSPQRLERLQRLEAELEAARQALE